VGLRVRILAGRVDRGAGSHVYHQELTRRLASRGYQVSLVCFGAVPEMRECAEVFEIPREPYLSLPFFWRFSPFMEYRYCSRRLFELELPPSDLVIAGEHFFLKAHGRMFPRTPWIYLPHSLVVSQEIQSYQYPPIMNWVSHRVYEHLQLWALNHANRTLRFTQQSCDALLAHYGASVRPHFVVNPMGIDLPQNYQCRPPASPVKILWVGQLIPRKRIDVALTALASLRQYHWQFDIVGQGESREQLEQHARELGLQARVRFHGFQSNPAAWYQEAHLLLFPSWLENSPVTMLESMSYGVPCLAMRADGVRFCNAHSEIIQHGVNGFLAESDEDFRLQLEGILKQPEILTKTGEAGHQTIAGQHTWDKHLDRYEVVFDELMSKPEVNAERANRRRSGDSLTRPAKPAGLHIRILAGRVDRGAGSHVYHQDLTKRLVSRGYRVSLVCFEGASNVSEYADVFEIPLADYNITFVWRFASLFQYRHITKQFMRLNIPPADIVIGGEHLLLKSDQRRFPQTPMIYLPHAPVAVEEIQNYAMPPTMHWVTSQFYGHLQRWALNHADRTLRFTRRGCELLTSYYGNSVHPRFVVNSMGFDLPPLIGDKNASEEIRLLSVGRLVPWKKIDLSLTALARLKQYRWRFDIVGEGEARQALERQVRRLGLEDRIRFHGFQPDLAPWYEQADLFLFPSACEGLGFVMLEAMSYGTPCLTIKADLVNYWNTSEEVIEHGKNGLLAADEGDFFRQLESALRHPKQLIPLGKAARQYVAEHCVWDKHLDRYEELFDELLFERRKRTPDHAEAPD
jgi:glycosyltransferase involved in cell wall biosynthesis